MKLAIETLGCGEDLVMVHGWGMNSSVWHDFAEQLAGHYRVTLIDLPGHGHSSYSGASSLEAWAQACLDAAPENAVWLGWSLGAMVTIQATILMPQRVKGLLIMAGMPKFIQDENWPHAMALRTLNQFNEMLGGDMNRALERFLALQMLGSDLAVERLRSIKIRLRERPEPSLEALQEGLELLRQSDLREKLHLISCPTAWIYGERDTLAPAAASETLKQWLPDARTHTISRAAHTPFLSHPSETEGLLLSCLEAWHEC
ncbi:MAG: pimeloyl-ACP methyl ester esterase BioH [Candidatus Thiodiazotropha sp.]|jgi:pimeloyl-[acyl-carrier protein] methyl ester esterase